MSLSSFTASLQEVDWGDISSWPSALKLISSLLLGVGILVAIYMMFYKPQLESLQRAQAKELELRAEFVDKQKKAANLPAYQAQMAEIKERFAKVLRQLPEESEIPALLTNISEAGVKQGLVFQRFQPGQPEQKNFYVRLPIKIQASGTYHQLAGFISDIANFQRIVTVGNLDLARAGNAGNQAQDGTTPLIFKADIYTYHFSDQQDLPAQGGGKVTRVKQ